MEDKLADLYIEVRARTDKMRADLEKVKDQAQVAGDEIEKTGAKAVKSAGGGMGTMLGPAVLAAGVVVAAAFADAVKDTMALGRELTLMSQKTGLSTTFLQNMGFAARATGLELANIEDASMKMGQTIVKAGEGNKAAVKSLEKLGLTYDMLKGKNPEEQFRMIFDAIAKIPDPLERAAAAQSMLGSTDFLPLIEQYRQLEEKSKSVGTMTEKQVQDANAAAVAAKGLEEAWKNFVTQLSLTVFPALTPFIEGLTGLLGWIQQVNTALSELNTKTGGLSGTIQNILFPQFSLFNANPMGRASATPRAEGGIVTKPELSLVGEAGPEAIIPLSQLGSMGGGVTVNVGSFMGDELSLREFTRRIQRILNEESRRSSFKPTETSYYSPGGHL